MRLIMVETIAGKIPWGLTERQKETGRSTYRGGGRVLHVVKFFTMIYEINCNVLNNYRYVIIYDIDWICIYFCRN